MISDFLQTIVGASCDSCWLACFELAPEPPPSWPGSTRAIHAAPPLHGNTWVAGTYVFILERYPTGVRREGRRIMLAWSWLKRRPSRALARGVEDGRKAGVFAVGGARGGQSSRVVPTLRHSSGHRLQMVKSVEWGWGGTRRPLAAPPFKPAEDGGSDGSGDRRDPRRPSGVGRPQDRPLPQAGWREAAGRFDRARGSSPAWPYPAAPGARAQPTSASRRKPPIFSGRWTSRAGSGSPTANAVIP